MNRNRATKIKFAPTAMLSLAVALAWTASAVHAASILPSVGNGTLKLHLAADAGVTEAGSGVSAWADQSSADNDFEQTTDDARPSLVEDAWNGNPVLRFDGADEFLSSVSALVTTPSSDGTIGDAMTLFVTARASGSTDTEAEGLLHTGQLYEDGKNSRRPGFFGGDTTRSFEIANTSGDHVNLPQDFTNDGSIIALQFDRENGTEFSIKMQNLNDDTTDTGTGNGPQGTTQGKDQFLS